MAVQLLIDIGLENFQAQFVQEQFDKGLRVKDLGDQPAPWLRRGLEILEAGGSITPEKVRDINLEGGTDHPDPYFG